MRKLTSLLLALCMLLTGAAFAAPEAPATLPLAEGVTLTAAVMQDTARISDLVDNEFTKWMEEQTGITLDKRKILIADPIKNVGTYTVTCKLGYEITAPLTVKIEEA